MQHSKENEIGMRASISDYLRNIPQRKRRLTLFAVIAGIVFPWMLILWLLSMHGSFANVVDFGPLRYAFAALSGISILVLIIALTSLFIESCRQSRSRFPLIILWVLSAISIITTLAFSTYVGLPQII